MKIRKLILLPILAGAFAGGSALAAKLSLDDYLAEVEQKSAGVGAARMNAQAGEMKAEGAEVLTFPYLFGSLNSVNDQQETANPAFQGTGTETSGYSAGLGWNSPFGLNGRYTFNVMRTEIAGASALPLRAYDTAYNRIDFTLNLVKNGFGSQIRAQKELVRSGNLATGYGESYQQLARLVQAETAYYRLAVARENVDVQKDVLARAERLLNWAKRRVGLQLGDQSDLLQAQASHELNRVNLSTAEEEERNAARAFNALRNREEETVSETVALPTIEAVLKMKAPAREGSRLDVQAAEARTRAAQAQAQIDKDNLKPNVDVVATYAWNGRDPSRGPAISESFRSDHPTKAIAVNFTVPLDAGTWRRALQGANMQIEAADLALQQTRIDEAKDWNDLTSRLTEARQRLALVQTLEGVQRQKYENERQRLLRGRTTTFQALTFEQDYATTQMLRLRTQAEVLSLLSQMKLYRGNQ